MSEKLSPAILDMSIGEPSISPVSKPSHAGVEEDTGLETEMTAGLIETLESQLRALRQQMADLEQQLGLRH